MPTAAAEPKPDPAEDSAPEPTSEAPLSPISPLEEAASDEVKASDVEELESSEELEELQPWTSDQDQVPIQPEPYSPQSERTGVPMSLIVILLLVVAAFGAIFGFGSSQGKNETGELVSVYVSGRANARDQPSAEGSNVLETYEVGTKLAGTWVEGATDPNERWLKFEEAGQFRYIWDGNLAVAPADAETTPATQQEASASYEPVTADEAIQFVRSYVDATSSSSGMSAADVVEAYYADTVSYFGKSVDRSYVSGEKIRYARRWPDRTYQIVDDTLQADCGLRPGTCWVSGTMWYSASSDAREAYGEGYAKFQLGLERTAAGIRLVSENSKVIAD